MENNTKKKRIAILGAGPAGMSAAYELSKHKEFDIDIYESASQVGGMAGSIDYNGQRVDFGPHRFFSKLEMPNRLWDEVLGENSVMVKRLTRMYYGGRFYNYPVDLTNVVKTMPFIKLCKIGLSYIYAKIFPRNDDSNYENRVINNFGIELYETFFKYYNQKLRGVPNTELGSDRVKQRIRGVSVMAILKKWRNTITGSKKTNTIKSWVDEFKYPRFGNGFFYEELKRILEQRGVNILLSTKVQSIERSKEGWTVNGAVYDELISTIPIDVFFKSFSETPAYVLKTLAKLRFRGIMLVYATLDTINTFPDNRIYLHSDKVESGRLTNFNNWSPFQITDKSKTFVVLEYWDFVEGRIWNMNDTDVNAMAENDLVEITGLGKDKINNFKIIRIPHGYPIYHKGYEEDLVPIIRYVKELSGLHLIGRSGSFKYNNQDHSLYMGYLAAKNISEGSTYDLRKVNSDEEYHEEG